MKIYLNWLWVILSIFAAGCSSSSISNGAHQARSYETRHPITLENTNNTLEIPLDEDQVDITTIQEAKILSFLYKYRQSNKSKLIISVPESGIKAHSARMVIKHIVKVIKSIDINEDDIRIGTYKPLNQKIGGIRINFESLIAKAPDCSDMWSKNLSDAYHNDAYKGHGCATRNNLASMIARPSDLIQMPSMTNGNADRRTTAIDKYVLGEATNASKGETASSTGQ